MYIHENRLVFQERPSKAPAQTAEAAKKAAEAAKEARKGTGSDGEGLTDKETVKVNPAEVAKKNGYDSVGEYKDGVAIAVKKGVASFLVDENGKKIGDEYFEIEEFHDGIAIAHDLSGEDSHQIIFINKKGKSINNKYYWDAHPFNEGKAGVKEKGGKWYFIDKSGKDLMKAGTDGKPVRIGEFDEVYDFNKGIAGVRNGSRWRYIKQDGTFLNDKTYDKVEDFENDFAYAKRAGKEYFVFFNGQEVENVPEKNKKKKKRLKLD